MISNEGVKMTTKVGFECEVASIATRDEKKRDICKMSGYRGLPEKDENCRKGGIRKKRGTRKCGKHDFDWISHGSHKFQFDFDCL